MYRNILNSWNTPLVLYCSSVFIYQGVLYLHKLEKWALYSDIKPIFPKLFWVWHSHHTGLDWTISMAFWLCSSSAAEEGQRALAHPHSLVQFLGSFIDRTAEQSLLSPNSTLAWLAVWLTASLMDHVQKCTEFVLLLRGKQQVILITKFVQELCSQWEWELEVLSTKTKNTTDVSGIEKMWCNSFYP